MLTGCAVEPAYVEARPARVYDAGPGPGYYAPEPIYGGTTVVAVERDRYVDRGRYHRDGRDGRDRSRTSDYRRSGNRDGGRDRSRASQYGNNRPSRGQNPGEQRYRRDRGQSRVDAPAPARKSEPRKKKENRDQQ